MKKSVIILILLAAVAWNYRFTIEKFLHHLPDARQVQSVGQLVKDVKQNVSTPPPLKAVQSAAVPGSKLTVAGVIMATNRQRQNNGNLPALKENSRLDQSAQLKVKDMFQKQYFEHMSPDGVGPDGLANKVGYQFIVEGENLALGNFKDDAALLDAWMNSPGHRANILNNRYTEIGVAVGKGQYEGQTVWLAVQEFGKPLADCPAVDQSVKTSIDSQRAELETVEKKIQEWKAWLKGQTPTTKQEADAYNEQVRQFNDLVISYDTRLGQLQSLIATYNQQVDTFDACAGK